MYEHLLLYIPDRRDSESRFLQLLCQQLVEQGQAPMASSIATMNKIITNTLETIVNFSYTERKRARVVSDVRGHKYVLAFGQTQSWVLTRAKNIFMPKNINCITIIITLEGVYSIKYNK